MGYRWILLEGENPIRRLFWMVFKEGPDVQVYILYRVLWSKRYEDKDGKFAYENKNHGI